MEELTEGMPAPEFCAPDAEGTTHCLKDYRGEKLLLYFYPKNDTPGCTAEACSLRDGYTGLSAKNVAILGVSPDDQVSHGKFGQKYGLPFKTLADAEHKIADAYGAWGERNMYGKKFMGIKRVSFLINEDGIIEKVIRKVDTKDAAGQVLKYLPL